MATSMSTQEITTRNYWSDRSASADYYLAYTQASTLKRQTLKPVPVYSVLIIMNFKTCSLGSLGVPVTFFC